MCGVWAFVWLLAILGWVLSSEFPERECCDLPSPQPTVPVTTTTSTSTGRPGKKDINNLTENTIAEILHSSITIRLSTSVFYRCYTHIYICIEG